MNKQKKTEKKYYDILPSTFKRQMNVITTFCTIVKRRLFAFLARQCNGFIYGMRMNPAALPIVSIPCTTTLYIIVTHF